MNPKAAITEKAYPTIADDARPVMHVLLLAEQLVLRLDESVPGPQHPIK